MYDYATYVGSILCYTIMHATMCQLSWIGSIFNRIFTTCIWDVSSHIVNVMLYCLICLSFFKYRFDGFRPLWMCSRPYIIVFEIIEIPVSFSFSKIPYRFHFRWKNVKVKMVESFTDYFRPFSFLPTSCEWHWPFFHRFTSELKIPSPKLCQVLQSQ